MTDAPRVVKRLLTTLAAATLLASCRVDVSTTVQMDRDGSGTITVEAVADPELVEAVPDLADELRLDDLTTSGWVVVGPTATDDGGLSVQLTHDFAGPDEATELLGQLNGKRGPYVDLVVKRTVTDDAMELSVDGSLAVRNGLRAFADDALVESVGGVPWADVMATNDDDLADVFSAELVVDLDGEEPTVVAMPADGSSAVVAATSSVDLSPDSRSPFLATLAGGLLLIWLGLSLAFAAYVLRTRRSRVAARR